MNNEAGKLQTDLALFQAMIPGLLNTMAETAKEHFVDSFHNQGFTDTTYQHWAPRNKSYGWPILSKTGALEDSIKIKYRFANSIVIGSDSSYGSYHNEGTSRLPKRTFMGYSSNLEQKLRNIITNKIKLVFK